MTFSQWMQENGYADYNSAEGRRNLAKQYGITGQDSKTVNLALWKKLKENGLTPASQETAKPQQMTVTEPIIPTKTSLDVTSKEVVVPDNLRDLLYNSNEGEGGTYYGGQLKGINVNKRTNISNADRKAAYKEWILENIDNPDVLFNPNYAKTRANIGNKTWKTILDRHPEYLTSDKGYAQYIPERAQRQAMKRSVHKATNEAAPKVLAAVTGAYNPLAAIAAYTGAEVTNEIVRNASDNKYGTWGQMVADKTGTDSELGQNLWELTNVGGLLGGVGGSRAMAGSNIRFRPGIQEETVVNSEKPITVEETIQHPGRKGGWVKASSGTRKISLIDKYKNVPEAQKYENNYQVEHEIPWTKRRYYRHTTRPWVETTQKTIEGASGEDVANTALNAPTISAKFADQEASFETKSNNITPLPWIPNVSFYNTARDWGSPEFQEWWKLNATQENAGKILFYNNKPIKITWDPNGYRVNNLAGNINAGLYPSGTVTDRLVLNRRPIEYQGSRIGYKQVGVTPRLLAPGTNLYGNTITMKTGGKVNYQKVFK